ncbi:uncharacterized protein Dana_GF19510 [Drosophila ananassae]|uniref:FHA domain-containing protein n=1 Tax=Drosophila ananassae TaxID=7217 RepID=B3MXS1_DROAN|nr:uncharacterized protein LOC6502267 [Drosophila ananassae]EDV38536.1 uncharacterized protein Dana_GF19510 [Drosophila ananassae]
MASLTIKGLPTQVMHTYQVLRIGSDVNDKTLTFCLNDKSIDKLHATLTRYEKGLFLVNESRHGSVSVNGKKVGGPVHITYRDTYRGCVRLRFGHTEALLRVSGSLTG